jgi:hypothetical protein
VSITFGDHLLYGGPGLGNRIFGVQVFHASP